MTRLESDRVEAARVLAGTLGNLLTFLKVSTGDAGHHGISGAIGAAAELAGYLEGDLEKVSE